MSMGLHASLHAHDKLENSILVLSDADAVFLPSTVLQGVRALNARGQRDVADSENLQNALFYSTTANAFGAVSSFNSSAVFIRFYALKAVKSQYFVSADRYSTNQYHLITDWSKYLALGENSSANL
eukprot:jgi/Hompol1/1602/HPOL_004798-RA